MRFVSFVILLATSISCRNPIYLFPTYRRITTQTLVQFRQSLASIKTQEEVGYKRSLSRVRIILFLLNINLMWLLCYGSRLTKNWSAWLTACVQLSLFPTSSYADRSIARTKSFHVHPYTRTYTLFIPHRGVGAECRDFRVWGSFSSTLWPVWFVCIWYRCCVLYRTQCAPSGLSLRLILRRCMTYVQPALPFVPVFWRLIYWFS